MSLDPVEHGFPEDPWQLLRAWLPANDDPVRPTMTLATIADGMPDARTVLLSEFDEHGLYFHTDSRSRKVAQLAADPSVALMLHLAADAHQLVVQGIAEPAADDELARVYRRRSPYLQQLAWQNTVEFAGLPDDDRVADWSAFTDAHADGFGRPPTWAGFLVRPSRFTFWFGSPDTASRRVEYQTSPGGWAVSFRAG
jgi:pyridoxamine 5'-phosphate oxidase